LIRISNQELFSISFLISHFLIPLEVDLGLVPVFLPVDCFPCFFLFNQATILLN